MFSGVGIRNHDQNAVSIFEANPTITVILTSVIVTVNNVVHRLDSTDVIITSETLSK